jgi:hypothetical protein
MLVVVAQVQVRLVATVGAVVEIVAVMVIRERQIPAAVVRVVVLVEILLGVLVVQVSLLSPYRKRQLVKPRDLQAQETSALGRHRQLVPQK